MLDILRPLCLCLPSLVFAQTGSLSFDAEYVIYRGENQVGESRLSLKASDSTLDWRLETRATGLYSLLTGKQTGSHARLIRFGNDFRLGRIEHSLGTENEPGEVIEFDWPAAVVTVRRENTLHTLALENAVYDYLSVHWLSAQMTLNRGTVTEFDFYRKGRLVRSTLRFVADTELEIDGRRVLTRKYRQTFQSGSRSYEYYYAPDNPLMPLRIEKLKNGRPSSVMLFKHLT